jgi:hypothetical protein
MFALQYNDSHLNYFKVSGFRNERLLGSGTTINFSRGTQLHYII